MATMGGYQTLIMRMSAHLIGQGHSVTLITQGLNDRLRPEFNEQLVIHTTGTSFVTLMDKNAFQDFYHQADLPQFDSIICIDMVSYVLGTIILRKSKSWKARVILGLFQPDSVGQVIGWNRIAIIVRYLLKQDRARSSVVAMLKKLQREWDKHFGDVCAAECIPLPVELDRFSTIERAAVQYRIVSVGRLDDYKTYNIYMIEIVRRLVDRGIDVQYEIYGEGPYRAKIEEEIEKHHLEERVLLRGYLAYKDFPKALQTAYCFVGMGTAAIEAAAAGVPVVYSPPRDMTGVTHGLFHAFDITELGGFAHETNPPLRVHDVLLDLMQLSTVQYEIECQKSRDAMRLYSMESVMSKYENLLSVPVEPRTRSLWGIWLYCDLVRVTGYLRNKIRTIYQKTK